MMPAVVVHRLGVGHRAHGGEPAGGGGAGAGGDRLLVLAARLAQVGVQVDEARGRPRGPATSITSAPARGHAACRGPPRTPSSSRTSRSSSTARRGIDHPAALQQEPRLTPPPPRAAQQQVEDRHAHRHAVRDLVEDHGVGTVRHLARDLDAAVHGAGMQDQHVLLRAPHALLGEAEAHVVLAQRTGSSRPSCAPAGCAAS